MFYCIKSLLIPSLDICSKRLAPLVWLLLTLALLPACRSTEVVRQEVMLDAGYKNPIVIDIPGNWHTSQYERNSSYSLWRESGLLNRESARITLESLTSVTLPASSDEILAARLDNQITTFAERNGARIIQEPISSEVGGHNIATAIFQYLEETTVFERLFGPGPASSWKTVEMRTITCAGEWGNFATVRFFLSNNEEMNAEARDIIDSIQLLDCE